MEPFATPQDMDDRTQGEITATSHPFLAKELAAATRTIRNHCGWHIATAEEITVKRRSRFRSEIWIPAMQISAAQVTTLDGVDHTFTDDEFDPETGWTSWSGDRYTLTYTAGYATVPEDLVTLTLELAAGALGSPLGITREQAGGVSLTLARASGALTSDDIDRLAEYRLGRLP